MRYSLYSFFVNIIFLSWFSFLFIFFVVLFLFNLQIEQNICFDTWTLKYQRFDISVRELDRYRVFSDYIASFFFRISFLSVGTSSVLICIFKSFSTMKKELKNATSECINQKKVKVKCMKWLTLSQETHEKPMEDDNVRVFLQLIL